MTAIVSKQGNILDMHIKSMSNESVTLVSRYNDYTETMTRAAFDKWMKSQGHSIMK